MSSAGSHRRLATIAIAVLAANALACTPAGANQPLPRCAPLDTSQPFLPWWDVTQYVLAPGGNVEDGGIPWTLAGGASATEGNEPFNVGGATDHTSLRLPPRSSATTAAMCVGVEHPSLRLFVRRSDGGATAGLLVEAIVSGLAGIKQALPIGTVLSLGDWTPTKPLPIIFNALPPTPDDLRMVAFRFTSKDDAEWLIDDVYVDPFRTG